ncbi:MAG TPA: type II CAAX endopeptidase family protein [Candidatus Acidoferrum sp.]|nr:type II CAAX endopeptidase family protein [Candidatus Acidoferrum sp.]
MRARNIFLGPLGLRSGCRLLIFLAIVTALQALFQKIVEVILRARGIVPPEGLYAIVFLVQDAITLIGVVIATWVMARWEHRRLSSYGLPGKNAFGRRFWEGAVFGYASVSVLILLIFLAGGYTAGTLALHGAALVRATLLWLLASLAIGFAEEYLFRGYPQFILTQGMGFWPAALLVSFLFGALHYFTKPYERWPDGASTGLLALFICLTLRRTGDLRFAIGFHTAFDFAAIFVYSGPNGGRLAPDRLLTATFHGADWLTGGKLGPEASLLVFPVIAAMFLLFQFLYRIKAEASREHPPTSTL